MNLTLTHLGLAVIAFVSAVLNFVGLSQLVDPNDWYLKSICALTAICVWLALYLFWSYAFATAPDLKRPDKRKAAWTVIGVGCAVVVCISTYWNLVALAGQEVRNLWQAQLVPRVERMLADSSQQSSAWLSLKPQIDSFAAGIEALANSESNSGALTGYKGTGGVAQTLFQIRDQAQLVGAAIDDASVQAEDFLDEGQACLDQLRQIVRSDLPRGELLNAASLQIDCVNQNVAALGNLNVTGLIDRSMSNLTSGVVMPATIRSERQQQAVQNSFDSLQRQADRIADSAQSLNRNAPDPLIVDEPNVMKAVLLFLPSIIPAAATALAIDLIPLILLIILVLRHRDAEVMGRSPHIWTLNQMADAQAQWQALIHQDPVPPKISAPSDTIKKIQSYRPDNDDWWDDPDNSGDKA